MRTQDDCRCAAITALERRFNGPHRGDQLILFLVRNLSQERDDLLALSAIERRERLTAARRQGQKRLTCVVAGAAATDESALCEAPENPAEVPWIEPEIAAELACGGSLAVCQLVEHARFAQGKGTLKDPLTQNPDFPRVEAIEVPDRCDPAFAYLGHRGYCQLFN